MRTFSDDELREALIKTNGQPTKAADALGVTYTAVYLRVRQNPDMLEIQKAARQKTFHDLSNFQVAAVLAGIVKTPELDDDGDIVKGDDGKPKYREATVSTSLRMEHANRLMSMFKGADGIVDQVQVQTSTDLDLSKLTDEELDLLEKAITKDDEKPD